MKPLDRQVLQAELANVRAMLAQRTEDDDPIGWAFFQSRVRELQQRLAELGEALPTSASVALFFGGRPVVGSRGIEVDFGGKALDGFENAVSTQLAALQTQGNVGSRGPIPQRARGQLLLTDIARGSLGFVLEESEGSLVNTPLRMAVDDIVSLIQCMASPDEDAFEAATESVDPRVLGKLRDFFKLVDDAGATVRIVEDDHDLSLPRSAVEIARKRVEGVQIEEEPVEEVGTLYLLPDSRRFELHQKGHVLRGTLSPHAYSQLVDQAGRPRPGVIGNIVRATLSRRQIFAVGREPRFSYRLEDAQVDADKLLIDRS